MNNTTINETQTRWDQLQVIDTNITPKEPLKPVQVVSTIDVVLHKQSGRLITIDNLIKQLNHPFAPAISRYKVLGRAIATETSKGKYTFKVLGSDAKFHQLISAIQKNHLNMGGQLRGSLRNFNKPKVKTPKKGRSTRNKEFWNRRTAEYHFGEGATW